MLGRQISHGTGMKMTLTLHSPVSQCDLCVVPVAENRNYIFFKGRRSMTLWVGRGEGGENPSTLLGLCNVDCTG